MEKQSEREKKRQEEIRLRNKEVIHINQYKFRYIFHIFTYTFFKG